MPMKRPRLGKLAAGGEMGGPPMGGEEEEQSEMQVEDGWSEDGGGGADAEGGSDEGLGNVRQLVSAPGSFSTLSSPLSPLRSCSSVPRPFSQPRLLTSASPQHN
jgi:hypothetical protein